MYNVVWCVFLTLCPLNVCVSDTIPHNDRLVSHYIPNKGIVVALIMLSMTRHTLTNPLHDCTPYIPIH